jgi:hypothetical protein
MKLVVPTSDDAVDTSWDNIEVVALDLHMPYQNAAESHLKYQNEHLHRPRNQHVHSNDDGFPTTVQAEVDIPREVAVVAESELEKSHSRGVVVSYWARRIVLNILEDVPMV